MKSNFYFLTQLSGRALLLVLAVWLAAVSSYAQSGSFGNTFIFAGAEMAVHGSAHNFQNGGNGVLPGIVGTERTAPQGFFSFVGTAAHSGAADNAHVDGYVRSYRAEPFVFPIGDNGKYRPAAVSVAASGAPADAAYFGANPAVAITSSLKGGNEPVLPAAGPFNTAALGAGVLAVDATEYWDINGATAARITLTWDAASAISALTTGQLSSLTIVGWNGSQWVAIPSTVDVTSILGGASTLTTGSITTNAALAPNTYNIYTLGAFNNPPVITSNGGGATGTQSVAENTTAVTTVTATDPENAFGSPKFTITGGADAAKFTIDAATGVLSFVTAPDFENPTDAGANNIYDVQVTVTDAGGLTDVQDLAVTVTDVTESGLLIVKVLLQGALFNSTTAGIMRDDLRTGGYIPLNDPYSGSGNPRFAHVGSGAAATTTNPVLNANAGTNDAIVDWVFVELRSATNSATVVETRVALLQRDGDVVSPLDGVSPLAFTNAAGSSYFVAVKHRNHLGAMTANVQTLTVTGITVDFTTISDANLFNKTGYDGAEMVTVGAVKALWAGNANADTKTKYQGANNDGAVVLNEVLNQPANTLGAYNFDLGFGYWYGDINMDGKVKYQGTGNDPSFIFFNLITAFTLNALDLYNYDLFLEQLP